MVPHDRKRRTRTLHGSDIGALDVVLELGDLVLELIERHELVLCGVPSGLTRIGHCKRSERTDDKGDLELLDTVADSDELARTPNQAVLLNGAHGLLELDHVGLIVPRLDLERHDGLQARAQITILNTLDRNDIRKRERTFATVFGFAAFFAVYAATRSALMRSASSSTSSSEPKRSTSSSSSSAAAGAAAELMKASPAVLEPDRESNSAV